MRAVNLIPSDARSGGGAGVAGRSGGAAHALLGALAVAVVMVALLTMTSSSAAEKRAELAAVQAHAAQAQTIARTQASAGPDFAALRASRTETVRALLGGRIDWAATLDSLARALPADITLSDLDAKAVGTAPAAAAATQTPAGPSPSITLSGCAPSQRAVAGLMPRLRALSEVADVQLVSSAVAGAGGAAAAGGAAECDGAQFQLILSLVPVVPAAPASGTPGATAAAPASTPPATTAQTAVPGTPTGAGG